MAGLVLVVVGAGLGPGPLLSGRAAAGDTTSTLTDPTQLVAEGESWPGPMVSKLQSDGESAISPLNPAYLTPGVSSSTSQGGEDGARQDFAAGLTDYAVTEAPLSSAEATTATQNGIAPGYVPYAAGAIAIGIAVKTSQGFVQSLHLTVPTLCKIFTGGITAWNDPEILAENPGSTIGQAQTPSITRVVRRDSSSTTGALINLFLSDPTARSCWNGYATNRGAPADTAIDEWPADNSANVRGLTGGSQLVMDTLLALDPTTQKPIAGTPLEDYIGYVAPAWISQFSGPPVAAIQNKFGAFVLPTQTAVAAAVQDGGTFSSTTNIVALDPSRMTAAADYPLVLVSYLLVPLTGLPATKAAPLAAFVRFVLGATGQADVASTGYDPAPSAWITAGGTLASSIVATTTTTTSTSSTSSSTSSSTTSSTAVSTTSSAATGGSVQAASTGGSSGVTGDPAASLAQTGAAPLLTLIAGVFLIVFGQVSGRTTRRGRP